MLMRHTRSSSDIMPAYFGSPQLIIRALGGHMPNKAFWIFPT